MKDANLCPLCRTRRPRRSCPALKQAICAVCCGTKRRVEISCPPDCGYLQSARAHPAAAVRRRDERELMFMASALGGTTELQRAIFAFLQGTIVRHAATAVPRLIDRDVADAADALAVTFETAAKGLIYEQQPASLPAQRLAQDLRAAIDQALRTAERPLDRDLAVALRTTGTLARAAAEQLDDGESAYLELLSRRVAEAPAPPLIRT